MSAPYRLIVGVDPSLSATGIAALEHHGDPGAWRLVYRATVRPPAKGTLVSRLEAQARDLHHVLLTAIVGRPTPAMVVAEDPSDFRIPGKSGPSQLIRFGAGVGVALLTVSRACAELGLPLTTYGVNEWLPTQRGSRGGGWRYPVAHKHVLVRTRQRIPGTAEATDDETMAAALALTHALRTERPVEPEHGGHAGNVSGGVNRRSTVVSVGRGH